MNFRLLITFLFLGLCSAVHQDIPLSSEIDLLNENKVLETTTVNISENENIQKHEVALESRGKKKDGMAHMYMMFMMCKSAISTIMMLIQPIFQVKALTISFLGLLINFVRFLMQLKESKSGHIGAFGGDIGSGYSSYGAQNRIGSMLPSDVRPNFISKYTTHK